MKYTVDKTNTPKAVTCPVCGELAEKSSYTLWNKKPERKGFFTRYTGKGTRFTDYQHEFDVLLGFIKSPTRQCKGLNKEVICKHTDRITSSGRCITCKMYVNKVDLVCSGGCGKVINVIYDKPYSCK